MDKIKKDESYTEDTLKKEEESIQKFIPTKYWEIFLDYKKGNSNLTAKLYQIDKKKIGSIPAWSFVNDNLFSILKALTLLTSPIKSKTLQASSYATTN